MPVLVLTVRMEAASSETPKCHMCRTAEGYCPHGSPYLWLKVCSPTEAEANTIALQKLEVWPRHKAKMLETPEPMTWKKGKIKHHSTFSARKKATPATNKLFPFPMARVSVHQVLLFFFPQCPSVSEVCPEGCDAAEQRIHCVLTQHFYFCSPSYCCFLSI